jgi:hypothetical protein
MDGISSSADLVYVTNTDVPAIFAIHQSYMDRSGSKCLDYHLYTVCLCSCSYLAAPVKEKRKAVVRQQLVDRRRSNNGL